MKKKRQRKTYSWTVRRKKKNEAKTRPLKNFMRFVLLAAAIIFIVYQLFLRPKGIKLDSEKVAEPAKTEKKKIERGDISARSKPEAVNFILHQIYDEFEIRDDWISEKKDATHIRLPRDFPEVLLFQTIIKEMDDLGCKLIKSDENLTKQQSMLKFRYKDKYQKTLTFTQEAELKLLQGKIAIIIDDFGYSDNEDVKSLLQLSQHITFAIIPGMAKSSAIYQEAQANQKEIIIHLPMEAEEKKVEYTAYTLYANMSDEEIQQRVRKALTDYPLAKGINNHMGSLVTIDAHIMEIVMQELKASNKFFIDSKTSAKSKGYNTARILKLPAAENDMFLERDRNDDAEYLRKKLAVLTKIAARKGYAVAIGHPYKNTIKVLLQEMPKLEKEGFVFVPASEIVNKENL